MPKSRKVSRMRELGTQLEHVYWIGGGSGAGKTTIARRIAAERDDVRQFGLAFIEVDTGTTEDELVTRVAVDFGLR
jgi:adenylylsulfate kinase-like enzyme